MQFFQGGSIQKEENLLQFVIFQVDSQNFALEIKRVKEILPRRKITVLPKAPAFLEGMIELRGSLIPVIDLRKRWGVSEIRNDSATRIIVLRVRKKKVGLIVDSVQRVLSVPIEDIDVPPDMTRSRGSEYILAVAKHQGELYLILDVDRLLSTEERTSLDEVKS